MLQKAGVKRHFGSNNKMRKFKEFGFLGELNFERWKKRVETNCYNELVTLLHTFSMILLVNSINRRGHNI